MTLIAFPVATLAEAFPIREPEPLPEGRGRCPWCGRDFKLTGDGTLRYHFQFPRGGVLGERRCNGSGQRPKGLT